VEEEGRGSGAILFSGVSAHHEDCVVVEVITVYTIFADELLEYPPNDEVMKLEQAQGQRL
jgi:hypothetical protein